MKKGFFITSDETDDYFVGIRFNNGNPEVVFPHGYNISGNESECRKDVFRLLAVIQRFSQRREGKGIKKDNEAIATFPFYAYQFLIQDYFAHGFYYENEVVYRSGNNGKIGWKRTIQKQMPVISNTNTIYLQYQVKQSQTKDDLLITQIHKYCVNKCFQVFGWLFVNVDFLPASSNVRFDKNLFTRELRRKLGSTFDDRKKLLFSSMLKVIEETPETIGYRNYILGVNHFASIWENLIQYVFGIDDIKKYFPRAQWHIYKNGKFIQSSALEPDTIMKHNGKIYILDAKYYRYGITEETGDLPNTSSIQKQITYGAHVAKLNEVPVENIYNAFVMPFNGNDTDYILKFVAVGLAGWQDYENGDHNYNYVLGILLDTKHLIKSFARLNIREMDNLAEMIESSLAEYREAVGHI